MIFCFLIPHQCLNTNIQLITLTNEYFCLQDLSTSLEAVYGKAKEGTNSEEILTKFYDWQCNKREEFASIRSETEASLQHLVAWFQSSQKVSRAPKQQSLWKEVGIVCLFQFYLFHCSIADIIYLYLSELRLGGQDFFFITFDLGCLFYYIKNHVDFVSVFLISFELTACLNHQFSFSILCLRMFFLFMCNFTRMYPLFFSGILLFLFCPWYSLILQV